MYMYTIYALCTIFKCARHQSLKNLLKKKKKKKKKKKRSCKYHIGSFEISTYLIHFIPGIWYPYLNDIFRNSAFCLCSCSAEAMKSAICFPILNTTVPTSKIQNFKTKAIFRSYNIIHNSCNSTYFVVMWLI